MRNIHLLPMASFPKDQIIKDDVEAPHQHSGWSSKVEHTLHIMKEKVDNELGFLIWKVPEYDRQSPAEYNPRGWRFGLHNRENLDTTGSEALKLSLVVAFGLGEQLDWIQFYNFVVPDPKSILVCYGLNHEGGSNLSEEEIKQVLALDALFLAARIDKLMGDHGKSHLWPHAEKNAQVYLSTFDKWRYIVHLDMCKIENQIPFTLIKRVIKHIKKLTNPQYEDEDHQVSDADDDQVHEPSLDRGTQVEAKEGIIKIAVKYIRKLSRPQDEDEDNPITDAKARKVPDPYLEKWMKEAVKHGIRNFMYVSDDFYKSPNTHPKLSESHHVLDAAYKAICGVNGMQRTKDYDYQDDYIHIPSARRLRDSGIKIVGVVRPLCTMSYNKNKKCLRLPKMRIFDQTVPLVRNLARYEQYSSVKRCMFHDYVYLMLDLLETPEDLNLLTNRGVIHNECGNRAWERWSALNQGLTRPLSSKEHNEMKRDINSRYKLRRYRLWNEFRILFLSRPWLTLSAIAVVLVTVATLVQTYIAVIGSNGMKPLFKP